ncbi:hypothetical protein [Paraburkholderia kururiensis]|uniref:Lipoprotein n=1 Tax=Paraburkholderia kururiensis TaxID=984307 RepID=A0ABZ0WP78_9BURK|nr:hypothetical protein [Paraburkholderia kururiensis]WQD79177.1 hypothetical protein U0042_05590 [Paraburkholderia kururiensis]
MNARDAHFVRPLAAALSAAALVTLGSCNGTACFGMDSCGGGTGPLPSVGVSGTAATGRALAGAVVSFGCADGSASTTSDSGGRYNVTFNASLPCILAASSGGTTLHSVMFAGGTFNTTPQTELMLVYLAAQLGTTVSGLVAGLPNNTRFQQALSNGTNVLAAQSAVVTNLQQRYAVTLAQPSFLTTPFVVGQPGVDSDLDALAKAGAIDSNGMPDAAAVSMMTQAGSTHPL